MSATGCGNMGSVLLTGPWEAGGRSVVTCDLDPDVLAAVVDYCEEMTGDVSCAADADVVPVAAKPDIVEAVFLELDLPSDQILVTIAAGAPTSFVEARTDACVVRIMPSPAAETRDMAAAATGDLINEVREPLSDVGEFAEVEESQIDIATVVNGSGPALVFYPIEAVTQIDIAGGLSEEDAEIPAAQTFKGAVETVVQDGHTVDELIDVVCSPNGTIIEGMEALWDSDTDDVVIETVVAVERRLEELAEGFADE